MQLFILRHGEAGSKQQCAVNEDSERFLTEKGQKMCQQAAATLSSLSAQSGLPIDKIIYSPFLRTTQSAEIVHDQLQAHTERKIELVANKALLGDNSPHAVTRWLEAYVDAYPDDKCIVLVSHQPLVSRLLEWWVAGTNTYTSLSFDNPFNVASLAQISFAMSDNSIGQGCADMLSMQHHNTF